MDWFAVIFGVIGGLALFLFGMHLLSEGLQKAAGDRFKKMIERLTSNRFRGLGVGAASTAIIQSSSITTVTLVGLINAGILTLYQAVPIILGANIGTTITAQIVAFKIGNMFLPIIALGFFIFFFSRDRKWKDVGQIILGFGILFLGMNLMSSGTAPLKESADIIGMLGSFGEIPLLGILAGAVFTGIIQSSSATTALVIAMGMDGVMTLEAAIPIILGANIGTCVTALLASIGVSIPAKRAAMAHILFNVMGVLLILPFLLPFTGFVTTTSGDLPRQIANAHTIFNVAMALLMLPFVGLLVKATKILVPGEDIRIERGAKFLDNKILNIPSIAISQAEKEIKRMAKIASDMLNSSEEALFSKDIKRVLAVNKSEDSVDELDNLIESYLTKVTERDLSREQSRSIAHLVHNISDIERIADHANNIAEAAERSIRSGVGFSKKADKEMRVMFRKTKLCYASALKVLEGRKEHAQKVLDLEVELDQLEKEFEENHLRRLRRGTCRAESGPVFLDIIRNLERISDHCHNIAYVILFGF